MRNMLFIEGECAKLTHILAVMRKTATARLAYLVSAGRTFVARYTDNLNDIRVVFISAHCHLDALLNDCSLLIDTATRARYISRNNLFRYIKNGFKERAVPLSAGNLLQNLVVYIFYLGIKSSFLYHILSLPKNQSKSSYILSYNK